MDLERIGAAARQMTEEWDVGPIGRDEAIGRAAVAAMIPVEEDGTCSDRCPFYSTTEWGHPVCSLGWMDSSETDEEQAMPSSDCPACQVSHP